MGNRCDWPLFEQTARETLECLGNTELFTNITSDFVTVWMNDGINTEGDEIRDSLIDAFNKASRSCFEAGDALEFGRYPGLASLMSQAKKDTLDLFFMLVDARDKYQSMGKFNIVKWINEKLELADEVINVLG